MRGREPTVRTGRDERDLLARLARVNVTHAFLGVLVVAIGAMFLPGRVGGALLVLIAVAAGALSALTWRVQPPVTRAARLLVLLVVLAIAITKLR